MISYEQFLEDLDGPLLRDSKIEVLSYNRGTLKNKMRHIRVKFGFYHFQIATGWCPEIGNCSKPLQAVIPFREYSEIFCTIRPDKEGEKLIRILESSLIWNKFKRNRLNHYGHITMEDFYGIYKLICKTEKLAVML